MRFGNLQCSVCCLPSHMFTPLAAYVPHPLALSLNVTLTWTKSCCVCDTDYNQTLNSEPLLSNGCFTDQFFLFPVSCLILTCSLQASPHPPPPKWMVYTIRVKRSSIGLYCLKINSIVHAESHSRRLLVNRPIFQLRLNRIYTQISTRHWR